MEKQSIDVTEQEAMALRRIFMSFLRKTKIGPDDRVELRFVVSPDGIIHASQWKHFVRNERRK